MDVVEALTHPRPCTCACDRALSPGDRLASARAALALDDALRGFGYVPRYERHGDALFRRAQRADDPTTRAVAVRFGECVHRRLVGSLLHECLHALAGDVTKANYGIPWGLPYGVPREVPERDEATFLRPFNEGEALAFVGVWILGRHLFGLDGDLRTARDVGTYCFTGGNALVAVPPAYRAVAHVDRGHHEVRYYRLARALEDEVRATLDPARLDALAHRLDAARAIGAAARPRAYPDAERLARAPFGPLRASDPCTCGREATYGACCGAPGARAAAPETLAR